MMTRMVCDTATGKVERVTLSIEEEFAIQTEWDAWRPKPALVPLPSRAEFDALKADLQALEYRLMAAIAARKV